MTHTQTERGRNQIRADLRLPQTTPVLRCLTKAETNTTIKVRQVDPRAAEKVATPN
jgi:hypothetical protein